MDFEDGRRDFCSATDYALSIGTSLQTPPYNKDSKSPRLLVRTDALISNVEKKMDTLAQQMSEMTVVLKNWQAGLYNL